MLHGFWLIITLSVDDISFNLLNASHHYIRTFESDGPLLDRPRSRTSLHTHFLKIITKMQVHQRLSDEFAIAVQVFDEKQRIIIFTNYLVNTYIIHLKG